MPTINTPSRFKHCIGLNEVDWVAEKNKKAFDACFSFVREKTRQAPFLTGPCGNGKSHLLWATANMAVNFADMIEITNGAEIAHELRASVEKKNLDTVINRYRQIPPPRRHDSDPKIGDWRFLIIDDLEVVKLSDWLYEEFYRIVNYRYEHELPTMVASNLSLKEFRDLLGDRITRRIAEMCVTIQMDS